MADKRTALITKMQFSSFGKVFLPGDEIVSEDAKNWPEGTLERRVANGFIVPSVIDATEVPETVAQEAEAFQDASNKLSKKQNKE